MTDVINPPVIGGGGDVTAVDEHVVEHGHAEEPARPACSSG